MIKIQKLTYRNFEIGTTYYIKNTKNEEFIVRCVGISQSTLTTNKKLDFEALYSTRSRWVCPRLCQLTLPHSKDVEIYKFESEQEVLSFII
jgi:hypothetical protein